MNADRKYKKSHIKRIPLDVQKDFYDNVLLPAAKSVNEPTNTFIKKSIVGRIEREVKINEK